MNKIEFAKIIRQARLRQGKTQKAVADSAGFTLRAVQYWERSDKEISLENADRLLKALGIKLEIGSKKVDYKEEQ